MPVATPPPRPEAAVRDKYGFMVSPTHVPAFRRHEALYHSEEEQRLARWEAFLARAGEELGGAAAGEGDGARRAAVVGAALAPGGGGGAANEGLAAEMRVLVQGGIPMHLRGAMWGAFTRRRGEQLVEEARERYARQSGVANGSPVSPHVAEAAADPLSLPSPSPRTKGRARATAAQVDKDVSRSLPGHPVTEHKAGAEALRNVLLAYAEHNAETGYTQGMNFVAALLLMFLDEEGALLALVDLVDGVLTGYFADDLEAMQADALVVRELLFSAHPALVERLESLGVECTCVVPQYLMCAFVNSLPWEAVLRVWDVLLFTQDRGVLFRIIMALFADNAKALAKAGGAGEALQVIQSMAARAFDASALVDHALGLTLDAARVATLREECAERVASQLRARQAMVRAEERHTELSLEGDGDNGGGKKAGVDDKGRDHPQSLRERELALSAEVRSATLQLSELEHAAAEARAAERRAERRVTSLLAELDARAGKEEMLRLDLQRRDEQCAALEEERAQMRALVESLGNELREVVAKNMSLSEALRRQVQGLPPAREDEFGHLAPGDDDREDADGRAAAQASPPLSKLRATVSAPPPPTSRSKSAVAGAGLGASLAAEGAVADDRDSGGDGTSTLPTESEGSMRLDQRALSEGSGMLTRAARRVAEAEATVDVNASSESRFGRSAMGRALKNFWRRHR